MSLADLNLDFKDIMTCKLVNKSWQDIVENPIFWLKISNWGLGGLSKENHEMLQFLKDYSKNNNLFHL